MTDNLPPLLPCPFCGGAPKTIERPDNIDGTEFVYAVSCCCDSYSARAHQLERRKTPEQAKSAATEAWNRRPGAVPAGWVMVPVEPTGEMLRAMSSSKAMDAEGEFPSLFDLIDYSGENKTRTAIRAAYCAMLAAAPQQVAQPSAPVSNCNVDMRIAAIAADRDYWREMCKEAERLMQAKPEQAAQQWQPIETAPKDRRILMGRVGYSWVFFAIWDEHRAHWSTGTGPMEFFANPTHWMPLPAAPQKPKD